MKNKKKFYWGTVYVSPTTIGGAKIKVPALIYGDSGLCINQFDPYLPKGKFTSVTHIATGCRIGYGYYTKQSAKWFCEAVAELYDWHLIKELADANNLRYLVGELALRRDLVTKYKSKWRTALVVHKLTNGGLTL